MREQGNLAQASPPVPIGVLRPYSPLSDSVLPEMIFWAPSCTSFRSPTLSSGWRQCDRCHQPSAMSVTECAIAQFSAVMAYSINCPTRVSASTPFLRFSKFHR